MTVFQRRTAGACIAYVVATQGAWADLTGADVWANWKAYTESMGYQVTGTQSQSGDVLTVTDINMRMNRAADRGSFAMDLPQITFADQGDGTVKIDIPAEFPLTFTVTEAGDAPVTGTMRYAQQNLVMTASGTPDNFTYEYAADALRLSLESLVAEGEVLPPDTLSLAFEMDNISGQSQTVLADVRNITQNFASDRISYNVTFNDPETDDKGTFSGTLNNVTYEGGGALSKNFDAANLASMLQSGSVFDGTISYASGNGMMSGEGEGEAFSMTSQSQGGGIRFAADAQHLLYDLTQTGATVSVTTQDLPFPIDLNMAELGFKLDMPVQADEAPQPFGFGLTMSDFTMSDTIWSIFDPAGALPRDPATLVLDATGTAKVLADFLDPAVAETLAATGAAPGELNSLKINNLLVSLVGAKLSGTGDFEFDNTKNADTMPAPSGVANLQLVGANALLDKLIALGFVAESDAMGARMMMGLLAVPGEQPDTLNSEIEFTKDGQILANGQRIK